MNTKEVIISGVHLDLTDSLKRMVREKAEKLFNHEERIIRLRVELETNSSHKGSQDEFIAKGHIDINGPSMVVSDKSDDLYKSIDGMINKLDRKLRRRARLIKVKRKHTHEVDIPADLPKVEVA
ncbi:ribosome hibernation-promoting factor, HPF/YfiA family [Cerasicoccus arenae]|uniref:Ribosome-associated translation inhibitor RaiA n=1 Tax=Cerasicoccus arenae TaxID=424488 RepID=A0A8J3DBY0_9BACT|nr:ribosome-associated translation inhibitor RaiA [Cerasicoccus arenae]MBK1859554.1 ribosome-associated translation inhibitor RaiA [Cerasicoccus arenae]GHC03164.1 hypothetical protein GCM10007047_19650 [Cerasicoccus arenae]